jgi:hypothetical protein
MTQSSEARNSRAKCDAVPQLPLSLCYRSPVAATAPFCDADARAPALEIVPNVYLTKFLERTIFTGIPAHRGASSGDSPVGRSRERLPAALACHQPRGRWPPPRPSAGAGFKPAPHRAVLWGTDKCRGGAPRGETSRSQGTSRRLASVLACLTSTQGCSQHPASLGAPRPLTCPQVERERGKVQNTTARPAPQNKRPAEPWVREYLDIGARLC